MTLRTARCAARSRTRRHGRGACRGAPLARRLAAAVPELGGCIGAAWSRLARRHRASVVQTHLLRTLDFVVAPPALADRCARRFWTVHNARLDLRADQVPGHRGCSGAKVQAHRLLYRAGGRVASGFVAVSEDAAARAADQIRPPDIGSSRSRTASTPIATGSSRRAEVRARMGIPADGAARHRRRQADGAEGTPRPARCAAAGCWIGIPASRSRSPARGRCATRSRDARLRWARWCISSGTGPMCRPARRERSLRAAVAVGRPADGPPRGDGERPAGHGDRRLGAAGTSSSRTRAACSCRPGMPASWPPRWRRC